jgi:hypothetical protein
MSAIVYLIRKSSVHLINIPRKSKPISSVVLHYNFVVIIYLFELAADTSFIWSTSQINQVTLQSFNDISIVFIFAHFC